MIWIKTNKHQVGWVIPEAPLVGEKIRIKGVLYRVDHRQWETTELYEETVGLITLICELQISEE